MKITIEDTILTCNDVGLALRMIRNRMAELSINEHLDILDKLDNDYSLMCACFEKGMRDPSGDEVYNELLRRTFQYYGMVRMLSIEKRRMSFIHAKSVADGFTDSLEEVRGNLESFVQDLAMVSLLSADDQSEAKERLYATHQYYMERLFNFLLVSTQWNKKTAHFYSEIILSPTIDQVDAALIVSALTLSSLTVFDFYKWQVLACVYEKCVVETVRQRALVGMILVLPAKESALFKDVENVLSKLCKSDIVKCELLELQIQMFYCMKTEIDNTEIKKDIMPTLMENNRFKATISGIVENEDDNIDDILDEGAIDKRMAEIEEKIGKMREMQKKGSDVYFGGFSNMKRFSFFYQISNWFMPFCTDHPDVVNAVRGEARKAVMNIVEQSPFCDSDKYSFALAVASVFDRLPTAVRELMLSGNAAMLDTIDGFDHNSGAYIRRMYLQNLYRFFNLYRDHKDFENPFVFKPTDGGINSRMLYMKNPLLVKYVRDKFGGLSKFLFKQHGYAHIVDLLYHYFDNGDISTEELLYLANSYLRLQDYKEAYNVFIRLSEKSPDNVYALKGIADTLFMLRRYVEAAEAYVRLEEKCEYSIHNDIYRCLSLVNGGCIKDGMTGLYRLYYENENNINVRRAMAWGCLVSGKPTEAEHIYNGIVDRGVMQCTDWLNYGYAKWGLSKNEEAARCFGKYKKAISDDIHVISEDFAADRIVLDVLGIKEYEKTLMMELINKIS